MVLSQITGANLLYLGRKKVKKCGLDSSSSGLGPVVGCCEHGKEAPNSIKGGGIS
jgi:hypothetical protein